MLHPWPNSSASQDVPRLTVESNKEVKMLADAICHIWSIMSAIFFFFCILDLSRKTLCWQLNRVDDAVTNTLPTNEPRAGGTVTFSGGSNTAIEGMTSQQLEIWINSTLASSTTKSNCAGRYQN